jgi:hypothetical protein
VSLGAVHNLVGGFRGNIKRFNTEDTEKTEERSEKAILRKGEVAKSRYPTKFLAVAVLCCLALLGCAVVKSSDLTGAWIVCDESRHGFLSAAQQKRAAQITLETNGTFVATEIPEDLLYGPPAPADGIVTGNGTWKLMPRDGSQQVQLDFEAVTVGQRGEIPYGTQLRVSGGWLSVSLYYSQGGDADQGRKIEFERK